MAFTVTITVRDATGAIVAECSGSAHEPIRWTGSVPDVDDGLELRQMLYDPDSRPFSRVYLNPVPGRREEDIA